MKGKVKAMQSTKSFEINIKEEDLIIIGATAAIIAAACWMKSEADRCEEANEEIRMRLLRIDDQLTLANERIQQGNELLKKRGGINFDDYKRK